MPMPRSYCTLFFFVFCSVLTAQTGQIRGQVTDATTGQPLPGATLLLVEQNKGLTTDSSGHFDWPQLAVGRYQVRAQYVGYQDLLITEIGVESGKAVVLSMPLERGATDLAAVEVTAQQGGHQTVHPLSVKTMTVEQVERFPASYYDPARMATSFAGVTGTNDQGNGLSIRGHSPNHLAWQLEGLPVANINHTPNAGTATDRVTPNSGGINMLSAQLLSSANLYTGAFPAQYGNALSGVMDLRLRPGNNQKLETTLQFGLIGLDAALEGPIVKDKGSFLVNYRYSTVGLLTQLGVDFGSEEINFQDLSFHLVFPGEKGQRLSLFGVGGTSFNDFRGKVDPAERETERDLFNVNFEARSGVVGGSWQQPVGQRGQWYVGVAASGLAQQRVQGLVEGVDTSFAIPADLALDDNTLQMLAGHTYYQRSVGQKGGVFRLGMQGSQYQFSEVVPEQTGGLSYKYSVWQPYLSYRFSIGQRWQGEIGLHVPGYENDAFQLLLEPRASLSYKMHPKHSLHLAYGRHSQFANPYQDIFWSPLLEPQRLNQTTLGHVWDIRPGLQLRTELYQQLLSNLIRTVGFPSLFAYNDINGYYGEGRGNDGSFPLSQQIEGLNYGLEISLRQLLSRGYYYLVNISLYRSLFEETFETRFDGRTLANLTAGKEWKKLKSEDKTRTWGLNIRVVHAGGFREASISETLSRDLGYTYYEYDSFFTTSARLPNFFRTDLRVYLKKSRPRYSTTLALDIQNATNHQNVAFNYYDQLLQRVEQRYQLSLIPLLSYRINF